MIAASPEISRYGIVFAAAHVFNSLDDHHETKSSRQFLPTENPEGPLQKGGIKWDISHANKSSSPFAKAARHELAECGDRGGFSCAFVFPKIAASWCVRTKLAI